MMNYNYMMGGSGSGLMFFFMDYLYFGYHLVNFGYRRFVKIY